MPLPFMPPDMYQFPAGPPASGTGTGDIELAGDLGGTATNPRVLGLERVFNVQDPVYGAKGDGTTDDTAAIQAAIDAAIGGNPAAGASVARTASGVVFFPAGTYKITTYLQVISVQGFRMEGVGEASQIAVSGNFPWAIVINGSVSGAFADFAIIGSTTADTVTTAVGLNYFPGSSVRPCSLNTFTRVSVRNLKYVNAFGFGNDSTAAQVDQVGIYSCSAVGQWTAGESTWWQAGFLSGSGTVGSVLSHTYQACAASVNRYNLWANACSVWANGMTVASADTDFRQSGSRSFALRGVRSDSSGRLFSQQGSSTLTAWAQISDAFFGSSAINADGRFIQIQYGGHVVLTNITCDASAIPTIWINNGNTKQVQIVASGLCTRNTAAALFVSAGSSSPATLVMFGYTQIDTSTLVVERIAVYTKMFGGFSYGELPTFTDGLSVGAVQELSGVGSPAGAISAPVGSTYRQTDGVTMATLWVKESGAATSSGWAAHGSTTPDIQWFTSSGTWTKPAGVKTVVVTLIGGGGGGGSGMRGAAGTVRCGGGGGGGGTVTTRQFDASDLTATVTVTVGAAGTGGAAQTVDSTIGNAGNSGTTTTFGTFCGGTPGGGGSAGTASNGFGGNGPIGSAGTGGAGANASTSGGNGVGTNAGILSAGGGASGGGITSGNVANNGANASGSYLGSTVGFGTAGVVDSTAPTGGTAATIKGTPGPGAGSGAASITTNAQAGATAVNFGGGGGGGGASLNATGNSGAGGNGGPGALLVISYYQ